MILEAIVTTINENGTTNISPMGPSVEDELERFVLRPFPSSTTYKNLKRTGGGVLHVTDDVLLLAKAAIGDVTPTPNLIEATSVIGRILADACRWYAFEVLELDDSSERVFIQCQVVESGRIRDFCGFNRAKHAVLEAAILATRVDFLDVEHIREEFRRLKIIVDKTAGHQETEAFDVLQSYIAKKHE